ncbi:hypothetical protein OF83DRAFT_1178177 [Amylostereum chailletii]|nr:hypothetical protein OF83DRAFT_1178177 [Amylostereum chailletii]
MVDPRQNRRPFERDEVLLGLWILQAQRIQEELDRLNQCTSIEGTMQTPTILELSGIGNSNILKKHGIPTVINLPGVGENFQDHPISFIIVEVDPILDSLDILKEPARLAEQEERYKKKEGIFASMACQQFAYISAPTLLGPDIIKRWQSLVVSADSTSVPSLGKQYEAIRSWMAEPEEAYSELLGLPSHFFTPASVAVPGRRYYSFVVSVMHPLSRGSVHIPSSNPADAPAIDPNYLDHPLDLEMLTSGATVAYVMPSQEICDQGDSALKAYVKETLGCSFHLLGTASMLPRNEGGVVDENLKVYGTSNLRVEVSAHTQSIVYAIAEKGADILKRCT